VSGLKRCYVCGRLVPHAVTLTLASQEEEGEVRPALTIEVNLCPACARRWASELLQAAEAAEEASRGEAGGGVAS
jgi:hypothetical protein